MTQQVMLRDRCRELVETLGLATSDEVGAVAPLSGGVASDIASVVVGDRTYCVKFPLEKFRVAEDWHAPVNRNAAEYAWLEFAGEVVPQAAPRLFGRDEALNGFAMEFLQGENIYLWKSALLEQQQVRGEAAKVGDALGRIHAASAAPEFRASPFQNQADFYDLRLDPYLAFTGTVHNEFSDVFQALIKTQQENTFVLIHGDVSPKNILIKDNMPVFLDAECATMGDPCFDVAFCLNHLVLKSFHMPDRADDLLQEFDALWQAYRARVDWEDVAGLEARTAALLPALMLARIDGKSPVEYLDEETRTRVREFSLRLLPKPPVSLQELHAATSIACKE